MRLYTSILRFLIAAMALAAASDVHAQHRISKGAQGCSGQYNQQNCGSIYNEAAQCYCSPCQCGTDGAPRPWFALKTNLLSDAALIPGIGAEVCLGNSLSLSADWAYAWWNSDPRHLYWSTYGGSAAFRYWPGRGRTADDRFTGHHIGLYGQMATFDFELGARGFLAADWIYAAGLEYGFSFELGDNLNLDLCLGAGWLNGIYKEYLPIDSHYVWQRTVALPPFSLTKAEVSLVWVLGRDKYRNGGAR